MTNPTGRETPQSDTGETAKVSKQTTGERNEDQLEGKDLPAPTAMSIEQPQQLLAASREAAYRARLADIWSAAHGNPQDPEYEREREIFLTVMLQVSNDDLPLLTDPDQEGAQLPTAPISGNIQEIDLEVIELLSRKPPLGEISAFMRSSIAATFARLERTREGTPELRVDIVVRVLFSLQGSSAASDLACELYRYLQRQNERALGFYVTATNLAMIVFSGGPAYLAEANFLYHSVLDGLRDLAKSDKLKLSEARGNETGRQLVSRVAGTLAMIIARRVREMRPDDGKAAKVLRDLKIISTVTSSVPSFSEAVAPHGIVAALRFSTNQPEQFLAAIMEIAPVPEAWELGNITTSRLEAAGGVAAAATGTTVRAVDFLFNAGISLRHDGAEPDGGNSDLLLRARMLINVVGLRLALAATRNLYTSLVEFDGMDCAVNFVSYFIEYYRSTGERAMNEEADVEALARELVHFAKWPRLRGTGRKLDQSRLEQAATVLGITVDERSSFSELTPLVDRAVEALQGSLGLELSGREDVIVDTANIVGALYGSVLVAEDTEKVQREVAELVQDRADPLRIIVERYQPYASPAPGVAGRGPALTAEVLTETEWQRVAGRLTVPVESVVHAIESFQA